MTVSTGLAATPTPPGRNPTPMKCRGRTRVANTPDISTSCPKSGCNTRTLPWRQTWRTQSRTPGMSCRRVPSARNQAAVTANAGLANSDGCTLIGRIEPAMCALDFRPMKIANTMAASPARRSACKRAAPAMATAAKLAATPCRCKKDQLTGEEVEMIGQCALLPAGRPQSTTTRQPHQHQHTAQQHSVDGPPPVGITRRSPREISSISPLCRRTPSSPLPACRKSSPRASKFRYWSNDAPAGDNSTAASRRLASAAASSRSELHGGLHSTSISLPCHRELLRNPVHPRRSGRPARSGEMRASARYRRPLPARRRSSRCRSKLREPFRPHPHWSPCCR